MTLQFINYYEPEHYPSPVFSLSLLNRIKGVLKGNKMNGILVYHSEIYCATALEPFQGTTPQATVNYYWHLANVQIFHS